MYEIKKIQLKKHEFSLHDTFKISLLSVLLLDVITTDFILSSGGFEKNPLMTGIVADPIFHLIVKIFIFGLIIGISNVSENIVKKSGLLILGAPFIFYLFVFAHNLEAILWSL